MATWLAILLQFAGIAITLIAGYFAFVVNTRERLTTIETRLDSISKHVDSLLPLDGRVQVLEVKYELFWKVLEPHLAKIIHSPLHIRRDDLLDKMVSGEITLGEAEELSPMLEECFNNNASPGQRIAAAMLLARTETVIHLLRGKV